MTTLKVTKVAETATCTVSSLTYTNEQNVQSQICYILEDGEREIKVKGKTRIPSGTYKLVKRSDGRVFNFMNRKYNVPFVVELIGIKNFSGVMFHVGNTSADTLGCLLTVNNYRKSGSGYFGGESGIAYAKFYEFIKNAFLQGSVEVEFER